MKTLLISGIYRPEIGGPATYLPSLAQYLMHLNHSVEIITLKNRTNPEQKEPWIVNYVNRDQLILIRFLKTVRLIFKKINDIDVILANGLLQETAVVISLIKKRSVAKVVSDPVWERAFNNNETSLSVVEFNTSRLRLKHKLQRMLLRWSLNRFDTITCPSAQLKRIIENWGVYKPIEYIPNGVMLVDRKSAATDFDLVTVCRLINLKNIDKIIKASSVANVSLAIVGSGSEELKLRELARSTNSRVTFFGQLNTNEVNSVLLRSKIYLNLSDHEGLSFSLLEAMSCGLPSIVSNIQGNTDIVSNGLDGIVVNVNDENQLVNAIKTLIDSPSKRLEYGRAARFKIESEYQQEIQIGKVVNLLATEIKNEFFVSFDSGSKGVVSGGKNDVIERHSNYGRELAKQNKAIVSKLKVFSASTEQISASSNNNSFEILRISKPTFNSYRFARKVHKYIEFKNTSVNLFVVGDPWESYWSAYFLNRFLKKKIPIQIQVHGDIADPRWRKINLKNRIRYSLAKLSLPKASSVRAVTKFQAENLMNSFGIKREKIAVVPVPINVLSKTVTLKTDRPKTIGLIGRIHQDRGIWEFVKLVRILDLSSKDFKVVVIGDGPSKDKFLLKLSSAIPKNRITYLGQLPQSEMLKAWKKIGVLVSMAPVESYGRVMREALIAGVPIWASESPGVKDLMDYCKKGEVELLDLGNSSASLEKDFNSLLKTKVSSDFSKRFIKENNTYAAMLANSWINTIKKSK